MHESEKWKGSRVWLLVTPWTAAYQAPPSMGFSRQEYWSGVPSPSPQAGPTCRGPCPPHQERWQRNQRGCMSTTLAVSFPIAEEPVPEGGSAVSYSAVVFQGQWDRKPQSAFKTEVNEKPPHDHLPGREARGLEAASHKTPCSVFLKDHQGSSCQCLYELPPQSVWILCRYM